MNAIIAKDFKGEVIYTSNFKSGSHDLFIIPNYCKNINYYIPETEELVIAHATINMYEKLFFIQISEIVGVKLVITETSSLNEMIEAGLPKFATQLEEMSAAATKEYALEQNLKKMKEEWIDIVFECVPYRETGVHILTAVDDIQARHYFLLC